jgi:hypothetical protein
VAIGGLKLGRLVQRFHLSGHGFPTDYVVCGSGIDQGDKLLSLDVDGGAWKIRVSMVVAPWSFPRFLRSSGQRLG